MPKVPDAYTDADIVRAISNLQVVEGENHAHWMKAAIREYILDEELRAWVNPLIKILIRQQRRLAKAKNEKVIFGPAMAFELIMSIYFGDPRDRQELIRIARKIATRR